MDLPKEELFSYYHGKITHQAIKDYGLEKLSKATNMDIIHGMIGGPDMLYKSIDLNQSYYIYHHMKNNLLETAKKTQREIVFMEDHTVEDIESLLMVVTKPHSYNGKQHVVLWGCVGLTLKTVPQVGVAGAFDMCSKWNFSKFFNMAVYGNECTPNIFSHCM